MATQHKPGRQLDDALDELEELTEEVRLKIHLAGMDAKSKWTDTLEPKLFEAKAHAREASEASRRSVEEFVRALRTFARSL